MTSINKYLYDELIQLVVFIRNNKPELTVAFPDDRLKVWQYLSEETVLLLLKRIILFTPAGIISDAYENGLIFSSAKIMHTVCGCLRNSKRKGAKRLSKLMTAYDQHCKEDVLAALSNNDNNAINNNDDDAKAVESSTAASCTAPSSFNIEPQPSTSYQQREDDGNWLECSKKTFSVILPHEIKDQAGWVHVDRGNHISVEYIPEIIDSDNDGDDDNDTLSVLSCDTCNAENENEMENEDIDSLAQLIPEEDEFYMKNFGIGEQTSHEEQEYRLRVIAEARMDVSSDSKTENSEPQSLIGDQRGGVLTRRARLKIQAANQQALSQRSEENNFWSVEPPGQRFIIEKEHSKHFKKFGAKGVESVIRILQPPTNTNKVQWLEGGLRDIITHITSKCRGHDYVGFTINSDKFTSGPVWSRFKQANAYTPDDLGLLLSNVAQSAGTITTDDQLVITVSTVDGIEGTGRKLLTHQYIYKKSIIPINNNDNLCLPRSLVVGRAYVERGEIRTGTLHRKWKSITDNRCTLQKKEALSLVHKAGVKISSKGCGIEHVFTFQKYFERSGIAIVIYEFLTLGKGDKPIFDGRETVQLTFGCIQHVIYILYYEDSQHFQPIVNLTGAIGSKMFCNLCNIGYTRGSEHRCSKRCPRCKQIPVCNYVCKRICTLCNRWFSNNKCFENHLVKGSSNLRGKSKDTSVCETVKICTVCCRLTRLGSANPHECNIVFCRVCNSKRPINHYCYMSPLMVKKLPKVVFLFYDFETQQHNLVKGSRDTYFHIPNLCVVQKTCSYCCDDKDVSDICNFCGQREFLFDKNPVEELIKLSLQTYNGFTKVICIAHNAGSFDGQFILRCMLERNKARLPKLILNGTKIIVMTLGNTIFLDSLNYLHMPLRNLPKTFGFAGEIEKGFFPHFFNTPENVNYIGPMPDIKYYAPDTMLNTERDCFVAWYNEKKQANYIFNFQQEFKFYCQTDVTVLRRACMSFRELFIKCGNVCPFAECTTIASTVSKIFRRNFLKPDTIAILPPNGCYRWRSTQSIKAISWLILKEYELGCQIINAARCKEYRLEGGIAVDGYYVDSKTNERIVLQFHGCFWHGCLSCYRVNRDKELGKGDTMDERYENTLATSEKISRLGYKLIEIWECEYDKLLLRDPEKASFLRSHPLLDKHPLNPRDAFFGGRTENFIQLYDAEEGEKIKYVDVCSLYPYICKTGKFPIGHPKIFTGDECLQLIKENKDLSDIEGLVKCTILAPRDLYHPVLPCKLHNRLIFALCYTCALSLNQHDCDHDEDSLRAFTGTWVVDEIRKAISKGYIIIKVHEIWQYEIAQHNPEKGSEGLFTDDINMFLKIKTESSGYPKDCITEQEKDAYIAEYEKAEGVKLDKEKITKNEGLRAVAKLSLNSLWGKFGQRENLPQTEIITTRARLMEMLTDSQIEITGFLPVNDKTIYLNYINCADSVTASPTTNVVIAAYTTAQARLKLYSYLENLGERVLYCDTDSCIYISKDNQYEPPTGKFLGDLTDELESYGPGSYISSFVTGGPKFYAYIVRKTDDSTSEVCKVKGITLNFENSQKINYNTIRSFILGDNTEPIIVKFDAIRRTLFHDVVTRKESKTTKLQYKKRRLTNEHRSLPFGYLTL
ncbi:uncharacterized protein LOC130676747 [Microplitis mediator]|uniref:uncharacterized protein LOC130665798 n=2 Tax=Microplitis mediator TaxID=375433 RepID=UPI0025522948|nr:uncharacterized protein LOC130665798 [Microplitis mediator]XP_057322372.1 uncharacterized protein LOC130665799 [Microplitis mediator]XP_057339209.1 uncharacterized protein LOC130676747 [Microplitis mediator]